MHQAGVAIDIRNRDSLRGHIQRLCQLLGDLVLRDTGFRLILSHTDVSTLFREANHLSQMLQCHAPQGTKKVNALACCHK